MSKRLSGSDRDILSFRPSIDFVEPDIEDPVIDPINNDVPQVEDVENNIKRLRDFAGAVDLLAAATQARADDRAKNMVIDLDPNVDTAAVQAMQRRFPGTDSSQITYAQYRECKDCLREYSLQLGNKMLTTPSKINDARDAASKANSEKNKDIGSILNLGGLNTPGSKKGLLRPELDKNTQVIEPVDIKEFQINMIRILVNHIWKNFIMPVFGAAKIPVPGGPSLASLLPDKLADEGDTDNIPGPILGQ